MFHHLFHVVLHEVNARFLQLLQLLQVDTVLVPELLDALVHIFDSFLVTLRCNLSLVFDSHSPFADLLHLDGGQTSLFMVKHRLLDGLFLFNGLLLQAEELLLGVLLHRQCVLIARPDLMTLLDAVLAVLTVMLVVSLQGLNHIADNILRGILHHPRQDIYTGPHTRDGNRKR